MNIIGGNISAAGTAAVGAAAAIPIVTKETHAFIGDGAHVTAGAASSVAVKTGQFTINTIDPRFDPSVPGVIEGDGSTLNIGDGATGLKEDERVIYDSGGKLATDSIGGLSSVSTSPSAVYYVHVVSGTEIQLKTAQGGTTALSGPVTCGTGHVVCGLTPPATRGEGHRLVPTDKAGVREDQSPRFNPATDVNLGTDEITLRYDPGVATDDKVVYSSGGGTPIGGLVDGATYYAIVVSSGNPTVMKLAATKGGSAINLTSLGSGKSHSIVQAGSQPSGDASETGPRTITAPSDALSGVAVTSTNSDDIAAVGVSAGFSGTAAVNLSGAVAVVTANTSAFIGKSATIDTGGDVRVARPTRTTSSRLPRRSRSVEPWASVSASASTS